MKTARAAALALVTLLLGGFLTFWLVRAAPGYDTDESELDGRRSASSIAAIRAQNRSDIPVWRAYAQYLGGVARGDLGKSRAWDLPIAPLLLERGAVTLRSAGAGLLVGWMAAVGLALAASAGGFKWTMQLGQGTAVCFLCLPVPALALLLSLGLRQADPGTRAALAVGLAIFARVLPASAALVASARRQPHLLAARARGVSGLRIAFHHVLRAAGPALAALLAASLPLAFSVAVPVEMVCNLPGAGQLAWLAAQKRDLPVLSGLTMALLAITLFSGSIARMASPAAAGQAERVGAR